MTNFLLQLKKSFSKFDRILTKNKDNNIAVITAMGDITNIAGLYRAIGLRTATEEINKQGKFTKKLVVSTEDILIIKCVFLICDSGQHKQARRP
jgi:hypothetical protein